MRPRDDGARNRRPLLLAARQDRRQRVHSLTKTHPFEKIDDLLAVTRLLPAHYPERQGNVLIGSHVIEQPEVLQHDTDPLAQIGDLILAEQRDIMTEQIDEAAGRPQRQEQQLQERGLTGTRRASEELEGMGGNQEIEVAQNLRAKPVAQPTFSNRTKLSSVR